MLPLLFFKGHHPFVQALFRDALVCCAPAPVRVAAALAYSPGAAQVAGQEWVSVAVRSIPVAHAQQGEALDAPSAERGEANA